MLNPFEFDPLEYKYAAESTDTALLAKFACHQSRYIRARVAGNPQTLRATRELLQTDKSRGVIGWLLDNPALTTEEYCSIFNRYTGKAYCDIVHPALARNPLATLVQLSLLLQRRRWLVDMAVVNNYHNREVTEFQNIIVHLMPEREKTRKDWTELEIVACKRIEGTAWAVWTHTI